MAKYQITCITKPNVNSPHEHITHVGNPSVPWKLETKEVIRQIDSGINQFYVKDPRTGREVFVAVVRTAGKLPYLRTHADGYYNDNLLSLNQCPA
jgi:hypothetical protein